MFAKGADAAVPLADLKLLFAELAVQGFKIGIASSDNEAGIRRFAANMQIIDLVDFIAGYDSGYGIKPQPGMVQAFAMHCGLETSKIAVIGDNDHDLLMARNADAGLAIGVLSGTGTQQTLSKNSDYIIGSIVELPELLQI